MISCDIMIASTKVYDKYQTVIPKEIRKELGIEKNDIIEWDINKKGNIELKLRKNLSFKEMAGKFSSKEKTNAVELKKKIQRGEKI